jgi:integrase
MATIRKRGDYQWQAIVKRKGYPLQSKTFNYRKDAEEWSRDVERDMDRGIYMPRQEAERTTVHDLIVRYRTDVLPTKRANWIAGALTALDEGFGKYALAALSPKLIATYRDAQLKNVSPSTVRQRLGLLSRLIDLAGKEWGIPLAANPCAMVSKPVSDDARDRRLEAGELDRLLTECSPHLVAIVRLAIETAARLSELLSLKWADVDLGRRVMLVRGVERDDGLKQKTKNKDSFRAIPLSSAAVAVLEELRTLPVSISGRVFWQWARSDSFNKTWVRACTRAGIADLRFHDLRHEATSRLFERGVFDSMEVASITGHKTLAMLKRYTHLKAEDLARKLG